MIETIRACAVLAAIVVAAAFATVATLSIFAPARYQRSALDPTWYSIGLDYTIAALAVGFVFMVQVL